ncbi:MAG: B12-binding domain-containing radical SAM protein [Candidatus Omnitrophica bacterium]|nr:B12-binding domain-containing radical SAM protein [Candidatus Omnitrophota bacterium]
MARILLIRTSLEDKFNCNLTPPLGLMYIAAVLLQNKKHAVRIIDAKVCKVKDKVILENIKGFNPEFIGISSLTTEMEVLHNLTAEIRQHGYCNPIIVGGAHASACPEDIMNDPNIDFAVIGEGEKAFPDLINILENKTGKLEEIGGIAFKNKCGQIKITPGQNIQDLDQIPFPRWDLVELDKYTKGRSFIRLKHSKLHMALITSRGCSFECSFCHNIFGKKFRWRSPENVLSEIKILYHQHSIRYFEILDDCFNYNIGRMNEICDLIIREKMDITLTFPNGLRGDMLNDESINKLYQAGTRMISFAPESGSPDIQKSMGKNVNLLKLQQVISKAVKTGIHAHGFFIIGFTEEKQDDINKTLSFAVNSDLHTAAFYILNPFPGTRVYERLKKEGKINVLNFSRKNYCNFHKAFGELDLNSLVSFQRKCYFKFYISEKRFFNIFNGPIIKASDFLYYFLFFIKRAVFRTV